MHYLAFVLIPTDGDPQEAAASLMAPYSEHDNENGWWDFWSIGGRWSGLISGYEPDKDPANIETCRLCGGSGTRRDMVVANGCNGCRGTGKRVKWPTQWGFHEGDVVTASEARAHAGKDNGLPYTLVGPGGLVTMKERWNGETFAEQPEHDATVRAALDKHEGRVAVVDYHS